jgi:rubrerythrin
MIDSRLFEERFLRTWEMKPEAEKTWENMKTYFKDENEGIKMFGDPTPRCMETINNVVGGTDVNELLDTIRRDAVVGTEQIQQMATSFKGATETMSEVMDKLKTAMDQIKVLNNTVATWTATNKQLADTIKAMSGKAATTLKEDGEKCSTARETNPDNEKCPICDNVHGKPWKDYCWELEKNKHKRPSK